MTSAISSAQLNAAGSKADPRRVASPILVTGGAGTLGRLVVARLHSAGHELRVLSRRSHEDTEGVEFVNGDLATGEGIEAAVEGSQVIVHCAGTSKGDEHKASHLVRAAASAGSRHLLYISVVGADRVPLSSGVDRAMFGYFGSKLAAEQIIAESGVPWTILPATQFHQLMFVTAQQMSRLPVIPVPTGFRFQPVDAREVADRLMDLALGAPPGLVRPARLGGFSEGRHSAQGDLTLRGTHTLWQRGPAGDDVSSPPDWPTRDEVRRRDHRGAVDGVHDLEWRQRSSALAHPPHAEPEQEHERDAPTSQPRRA